MQWNYSQSLELINSDKCIQFQYESLFLLLIVKMFVIFGIYLSLQDILDLILSWAKMTSEIRQLLETLIDYSNEEQHEFLESICNLDMMLQLIPMMWKNMQGDKPCGDNDEENITDNLTSIKKVRNHELNN